MMHDKQTIVLSYKSVVEAIGDYLTKHFAKDVPITVEQVQSTTAYGLQVPQTLTVDFYQTDSVLPPGPPADTEGKS